MVCKARLFYGLGDRRAGLLRRSKYGVMVINMKKCCRNYEELLNYCSPIAPSGTRHGKAPRGWRSSIEVSRVVTGGESGAINGAFKGR
jgi:hypothetical protein